MEHVHNQSSFTWKVAIAFFDPLQVRQELVNLGGRHLDHEGFCTEDEDRSSDAWGAMPWMVPDAAEDMLAAEDAGRGPEWGPGVAAAVPPPVLDFLRGCSAADGCELLAGWAAEGLPGLDVGPDTPAGTAVAAHGGAAAEAAAIADGCGCVQSGGALCSRHAVWRGLCEAWAGSFVDADLQALQSVLCCLCRLGRRHPALRAASAAAADSIQRMVEQTHGSRLRQHIVFDH